LESLLADFARRHGPEFLEEAQRGAPNVIQLASRRPRK
jgi:hypothetical protein